MPLKSASLGNRCSKICLLHWLQQTDQISWRSRQLTSFYDALTLRYHRLAASERLGYEAHCSISFWQGGRSRRYQPSWSGIDLFVTFNKSNVGLHGLIIGVVCPVQDVKRSPGIAMAMCWDFQLVESCCVKAVQYFICSAILYAITGLVSWNDYRSALWYSRHEMVSRNGQGHILDIANVRDIFDDAFHVKM